MDVGDFSDFGRNVDLQLIYSLKRILINFFFSALQTVIIRRDKIWRLWGLRRFAIRFLGKPSIRN